MKFLLANPIGSLLHPRRMGPKLRLQEVQNILILRYDALGDAVLSTPLWRSIKKYAPHIHVGVVGSERNRRLLEADPDIDEVFVFSRSITPFIIRELIRARRTKWDAVLNLFFHDKTRAAIYAKLVAPQGISATIVREKKEKYERLYSVIGDRPPLHPPTSMVLQNLQVMREVIEIPLTPEDKLPTLHVDTTDEQLYMREIEERLRGFDGYVIINTDASQVYREWGLENCLTLSRLILDNSRLLVFLSCAPQRRQALKEFLDAHPHPGVQLLFTPTVNHLTIAAKHASAVVSPDTSVIHFASAVNRPVVGFYVEESEFLPVRENSRALFPADRRTVPSIPVESAYEALRDLGVPLSPLSITAPTAASA